MTEDAEAGVPGGASVPPGGRQQAPAGLVAGLRPAGQSTELAVERAWQVDLWRRVRAGDGTAWASVSAIVAECIVQMARELGVQWADAEDAMQETLDKARVSWAACREPDRLRSWLHQIAHNALVDQQRKQARRRVGPLEPPQEHGEDTRSPGRADPAATPPLDALLSAEECAQLMECIAGLPPAERMVVLMHFWEDLTEPAIRAVLGLQEYEAYKLQYRAQNMLRRCLDKKHWFDRTVRRDYGH